MPSKREYLASLEPPLAKPGRGRFSREALAAIAQAEAAGMVFDDPLPPTLKKPHPKPAKPSNLTPGLSPAVAAALPGAKAVHEEESEDSSQHTAGVSTEPPLVLPTVKPQEIVRDVKSLNGYTKEGWKVNFATCAKCANHVRYCKCSGGPHAPSIVVSLDKDSPAQVG